MKVVVAYVDAEVVEPIRESLLESGFLSMSVVPAEGSVPEPIVTGKSRGVAVERHLRPKARLECVVGPDQVQTVVETVDKLGGERYFVFVAPIEAAYPTDTVNLEAAAQEA